MNLQQKIGGWLLSAIVIWQVSLTDTSNTRQADNARRLLYVIAGGTALGLLMRPTSK